MLGPAIQIHQHKRLCNISGMEYGKIQNNWEVAWRNEVRIKMKIKLNKNLIFVTY